VKNKGRDDAARLLKRTGLLVVRRGHALPLIFVRTSGRIEGRESAVLALILVGRRAVHVEIVPVVDADREPATLSSKPVLSRFCIVIGLFRARLIPTTATTYVRRADCKSDRRLSVSPLRGNFAARMQ
jgi:hypothetical protein